MNKNIGILVHVDVGKTTFAEQVLCHTKSIILRKHKVPTFLFINKVDRMGAEVDKVIDEIRLNFTKDICYIKDSLKEEEMNEGLIEFIAERDEELFEIYLEEGYKKDLWVSSMRTMIKKNSIFPCLSGSALNIIWNERLL